MWIGDGGLAGRGVGRGGVWVSGVRGLAGCGVAGCGVAGCGICRKRKTPLGRRCFLFYTVVKKFLQIIHYPMSGLNRCNGKQA